MKNKPDIMLSVKQAADFIGVFKTTIPRMIARGEIIGHVKINEKNPRRNRWQISYHSLEQWLKRNR